MQYTCHIICIGNEIMLGHIKNTNAQYISNKVSGLGIKVTRHISIPDDEEIIVSSIKKTFDEANIVIITGGLGPTVDDVTLECISKALDKKLVFNEKIAESIKAHFKMRRFKMPKNNLHQALIPEDAKYIMNNTGTAPSLIIPIHKKVLIALPGVPYELYPMFEKAVVPFLKKNFPTGKIIKSRIIKITGLPESKINEKIEDILRIKGNVQMGIYPHPEEITVRITVTADNEKNADTIIKNIENKIKARLKKNIFGYDNETLEEIIARLLIKRRKTLSIAESCTGGLLSNRLTNIPGSSKFFNTAVVAYSNQSKNKFLNIPLKTIKRYGAVSKKVAGLMAKNIRILACTHIGIGISGIAGPSGGTKKKPVGLVYIAVSTKAKTVSYKCRFLGQREIIKYKATQYALNMVRRLLV